MVYNLRVFLFKMQFFHNSNVFGCCIIHILCTWCAKIKKAPYPFKSAFYERTKPLAFELHRTLM